MKSLSKLVLPVLLVMFIAPNVAMASGKVPFVGTRYFNINGTASGSSITIKKNGNVVIEDAPGFYGEVYHGKYSTLMPAFESGRYFTIKGNKIYIVDSKGKMFNDCTPWQRSDSRCVDNLIR
ncbi:hypothetical protein [Moraxella pluranimalium]|uniref:WG repeat-containing protein n=1 Tax=Moraxella pluranimalium TaxID=470453 RepID=A0A1T0CT83_9GAMM|nr:hypothetical protein [Moraxella pluranimalium]OOS25544.1 hypothetical protein B0680_01550 [Moraxella pluranimalium]